MNAQWTNFLFQSSSFLQPLRPMRPSSAQPRASTEDVGKLRSSQSSRQVNEPGLNATVGHAPRRPRAPETHDEAPSATAGGSNLAATAPVSKVVVPKVAKVSAPSSAAEKPASAEVAPQASPRAGVDHASTGGTGVGTAPVEIEWSTEPLPPQWERKLPKGTNKVHLLQPSSSFFFLLCTNLSLIFVILSMFTSTMLPRRRSGTTPGTLRNSSDDRRPRNPRLETRTRRILRSTWVPAMAVSVEVLEVMRCNG